MRTKLIHGLVLTGTMALAAAGCGPSYPKCDTDEDCHEGEFCVNGQCQMCRDNADCPTGQACNAGRCDAIPGFCQTANDCPSGQECQDNRCVAAAQASEEVPEPAAPAQCQLEPVYFGFDQDTLDGAARAALQQSTECMRQRQITNVHATGHCDPRGTEEYNLALGDRRARTVKQYLTSLGVAAANVSASSMGEEMARGTDEGSWARDRRVDLAAR